MTHATITQLTCSAQHSSPTSLLPPASRTFFPLPGSLQGEVRWGSLISNPTYPPLGKGRNLKISLCSNLLLASALLSPWSEAIAQHPFLVFARRFLPRQSHFLSHHNVYDSGGVHNAILNKSQMNDCCTQRKHDLYIIDHKQG